MSKKSENQNDQVEQPQINSTGRPDKGLPENKALLDLARTYLEIQHRLWPKLVGSLLPAITEAAIDELAAAFRERFLSGKVGQFQPVIDSPLWLEIGAAYVRYSCDASNPRSLDQQLRNALERAAQDKVFIPWEYVFADAAVSGTTAARRGYLMIKSLIRDKQGIVRHRFSRLSQARDILLKALASSRVMSPALLWVICGWFAIFGIALSTVSAQTPVSPPRLLNHVLRHSARRPGNGRSGSGENSDGLRGCAFFTSESCWE